MAQMTALATVADPQAPSATTSRLLGVDVARAIAQLGMLITHYTYFDGSGGDLRAVTRFASGKAMPLFVFLGGLGFTMLTRRAAHPVAQVLGRSVVLFALGLVLVEHAPLIAVVLQFYATYVVLGLVVRFLPSAALLTLAVVAAAAGSLVWLHLAPHWERYGGWEGWATVTDPGRLLMDLLVTGVYPVLPTFALFLVGMWVGRLRLASPAVQRRLAIGGLAIALVGLFGGELATRATTDADDRPPLSAAEIDRVEARVRDRGESLREAERAVVRDRERAAGAVPLTRLLDPVGHGKMPAWVLGAAGFSCFVLGGSLLAYGRWPRFLRPVAMAGQLALTFYVLQAMGLRWWYQGQADSFSYRGELAWCLAFFGLFVAVATVVRLLFARGPLEAVLRWSGQLASLPVASRRGQVERQRGVQGRDAALRDVRG